MFAMIFGMVTVATKPMVAQTWNGAGADDNWTTPENWSPGVPANDGTATVILEGSTRPTPQVNAAWSILGLQVDTAAGFQLGGEALTVGTGGILKEGASGFTADNAFVLSADQSWVQQEESTLLFGASGSVDLGTFTLTLNTTNTSVSGALTIASGISGTGAIVKSGAGFAVLSGANTYSGGTTVSAGTLEGTLGSIQGAVSVDSGATLVFRDAGMGALAADLDNEGTVAIVGAGSDVTIVSAQTGNTGATQIGDGATVRVADDAAFGTSTVTVNPTLASTLVGQGGPRVLDNALVLQGDLAIEGSSIEFSNSVTLDDGIAPSQTLSVDNTTHLSGVVSGGGLVKTGDGTLRLSNTNTYTGGTVVAGGNLEAAQQSNIGTGGLTLDGGALKATASGTFTEAVQVGASGGTINTGTFTTSLTGGVDGSGTLTKSGTGTLDLGLLSGNTHSGQTIVAQGTLRAQSVNVFSAASEVVLYNEPGSVGTMNLNGHNQTIGGLAGLGTVVTTTATDLTIAPSGASEFGGTINGNIKVIIDGTGSQRFVNEQSTYSGGTEIKGGTLIIRESSNLGGPGAVTLDGGTLEIATGPLDPTTSNQIGFSTTRTVNVGLTGGALSIANGRTATFSGPVTGIGAGVLEKTGDGILILTNGANSYDGGTLISDGTLRVGNFSVLGSGGVEIGDNATLETTSAATTTKAITVSGFSTIRVADTTGLTLNTGVGGAGALVKQGGGTLTLGAAGTQTGGVFIQSGTVNVAADDRLGDAAAGVVIGSGTLRTTSGFTSARALSVNGLSSTVDVNSGVLTWNGDITGAGRLNKSGSGILHLGGNNNPSGGFAINAGTLRVASTNALGGFGADVRLGAGTLQLNAALNLEQDFVVASSSAIINTGAFASALIGTVTADGFVFDPQLTKQGAGTLSWDTVNAYSGSLAVSAGSVVVGNAGAFSNIRTLSLHSSGSSIDLNDFNGSVSGFSSVLGSTVDLGSGTLTLRGGGSGGSAGGAIVGTGGSVIVSGGSYTFDGTNTYTGTTTINGGSLRFGTNASAVSGITVGSSGYAGANFAIDQTFLDKFNKSASSGVIGANASSSNNLDLTGFNAGSRLGTSTFATLTGAITPHFGGFRFGGGGGTLTVNSNLVGAHGVDAENGTLLLGGSANTYSAGTVAGFLGTIVFTNAGALPASGNLVALSGGYIGSEHHADQAFLDRFDKAATQGTIGLNTNSTGALDLTGFGAFARLGTTDVVSVDHTITPQGSVYRFGGGGGQLTVNSTLTGSRAVEVDDLSLVLANSNTYTGGTTVGSTGSIQIASDSALGNSVGGLNLSGSLVTDGTFTLNRDIVSSGGDIASSSGTLTIGGEISGSFLQLLGGNYVLSGANTLTSGLYIDGATVTLGANDALGSSVVLYSGSQVNLGTFSQTANIQAFFGSTINTGSGQLVFTGGSLNGTLTGAGSLVKASEGSLSVSNTLGHTGGTVIENGLVELFSGGSLGSGTVTLEDATLRSYNTSSIGSDLQISGTGGAVLEGTYNLAGSLTGSQNLTVGNGLSSGTLILSGGGTHTGTIDVALGRVTINSAIASSVSVQGGSTSVTGTGSTSGDVVVGDGGVLAPGNSVGTLTVGDAEFVDGGVYEWEISSATGPSGSDLLDVDGELLISATSGDPFTIRALTLNGSVSGLMSDFNAASNYTWNLVTFNSIVGFSADKFALDLSGFLNATSGTFSVGISGSNLVLNYTAGSTVVPEPSTWGLLALAAAFLWLVRTRSRNARTAT